MLVDAADRFNKRHDAVLAQRSANAKRALIFLASKNPQMKEALVGLAKLELERRNDSRD